MGNDASSYKEVFHLQEGIPNKSLGKIIGAYLNYEQFPISGVIGISSTCIENFNAMNGNRINNFISPSEITCSDFNCFQGLLVVGFNDGKVFLINPNTLAHTKTLHYDPKQVQEVIATAVNCHLPGRIVVGYSNGIAKEFKIGEEIPDRKSVV